MNLGRIQIIDTHMPEQEVQHTCAYGGVYSTHTRTHTHSYGEGESDKTMEAQKNDFEVIHFEGAKSRLQRQS